MVGNRNDDFFFKRKTALCFFKYQAGYEMRFSCVGLELCIMVSGGVCFLWRLLVCFGVCVWVCVCWCV